MKPAATISFSVLVRDQVVVAVSRSVEETVSSFFSHVKGQAPADLLSGHTIGNCEVYRLLEPVKLPERLRGGTLDGERLQACTDPNNRERIYPAESLRVLGTNLQSRQIHVVIEASTHDSEKAIETLGREHGDLFQCLKITLGKLRSWTLADVENNLRGGNFYGNGEDLPPGLDTIQSRLALPRTYKAETARDNKDLEIAQTYDPTLFGHIFKTTSAEPRVTDNREFATFYHVLRCFQQDAHSMSFNNSSLFKASNFTVYFVQPPFFSQGRSIPFHYHQEMPWGYPIFLNTPVAPDTWRKFTPKSNFMVSSDAYCIPFVISEVISDKSQSVRYRMLVQAIATARAGRFLLKNGAQGKFFVVAIYLRKHMVAERYIVMQTGEGDGEGTEDLSQGDAKDFDLASKDDAVEFVREMYNLATELRVLAKDLDVKKKGGLTAVKAAASKVISLYSKVHPLKTAGGTPMEAIQEDEDESESEEDSEFEDEDDLGVFEAEDIQDILRQMNYEIEFVAFGSPVRLTTALGI
ncbi:hypothetical protein HYDPIDRAFT_33043 [Hydnomerulius pinastri MD-312]|uniref:Uncharacterized protein n=1 Tax=Hydnomerulius pinastri MD-312 TaxID=994086 RepID=A0A0C9W158_9AGAM|nr:hypothetical protein HYDPIDRAFT_33043 [Hydnomerulius pinastri MD-312]